MAGTLRSRDGELAFGAQGHLAQDKRAFLVLGNGHRGVWELPPCSPALLFLTRSSCHVHTSSCCFHRGWWLFQSSFSAAFSWYWGSSPPDTISI